VEETLEPLCIFPRVTLWRRSLVISGKSNRYLNKKSVHLLSRQTVYTHTLNVLAYNYSSLTRSKEPAFFNHYQSSTTGPASRGITITKPWDWHCSLFADRSPQGLPYVTLPSLEYTLTTFQLQLQPITRPATTTRSQGLPNVTLQLHSLQLPIDLNQFCLT